jgi:prevent-host-death family protein
VTTEAKGGSEIGVRELKSRLSAHLGRVKAGETLVVTERGRPIAKLVPVEASALPTPIARLLASGQATWSGQRVPSFDPLPLTAGGPTAAEMISEDRR